MVDSLNTQVPIDLHTANGKVIAWIETRAVGQQVIHRGDQLIAACKLWLPTAGSGDLHEELRFCERLSILDEALVVAWGAVASDRTWKPGTTGPIKWRWKELQCLGPTWKLAFIGAETHVITALANLQNALSLRSEAFNSEGVEHYLAKNLLPEKGVNHDAEEQDAG